MPYREKKFSDMLVGDVYDKIVLKAPQVKRDAKIGEVIDQMLINPLSRKVYVVDDLGRYVGTVTTETILRLMGYRFGVRENSSLSFFSFIVGIFDEDAESIMNKNRTVTKDTKLTAAMQSMLDDHIDDLPVVDAEGKLIGELVSLELFLVGKKVFEEKE